MDLFLTIEIVSVIFGMIYLILLIKQNIIMPSMDIHIWDKQTVPINMPMTHYTHL